MFFSSSYQICKYTRTLYLWKTLIVRHHKHYRFQENFEKKLDHHKIVLCSLQNKMKFKFSFLYLPDDDDDDDDDRYMKHWKGELIMLMMMIIIIYNRWTSPTKESVGKLYSCYNYTVFIWLTSMQDDDNIQCGVTNIEKLSEKFVFVKRWITSSSILMSII